MSLLATPGSGWPDEPASFERLPPEILLPIVTSLPGLDTLWNLMRVSPSTFRLFNSHALAITEGILSGPNSILPPKVQELVRGVILARSTAVPFKNLHEFQVCFMCGLFPYFVLRSKELLPLGPGALSVTHVSVVALRSVVATACQISALSQACLASCLERSRALKVLHAADPKICYTDDYGRPDELIPAWNRKYPGVPAKMVDAGQPTWVEEMRVVRAIWMIQVVGEVRYLFTNRANMIGWSDEDIDKLDNMGLVDWFRVYRTNYGGEEIKSAMEYLTTLGEATTDAYFQLPRPPSASPATRWATALPIPEKVTWVLHGYCRDGEFHYMSPDSHVPAGAKTLKVPRYSDDDYWGKTEPSLNKESFGANFFRELTNNRAGPGESPIPGVKFDSFRPLGFAFWDQYRMHLWGLAPPLRVSNDDFYFFAWESILPPEEVEGIKNELAEE